MQDGIVYELFFFLMIPSNTSSTGGRIQLQQIIYARHLLRLSSTGDEASSRVLWPVTAD